MQELCSALNFSGKQDCSVFFSDAEFLHSSS